MFRRDRVRARVSADSPNGNVHLDAALERLTALRKKRVPPPYPRHAGWRRDTRPSLRRRTISRP